MPLSHSWPQHCGILGLCSHRCRYVYVWIRFMECWRWAGCSTWDREGVTLLTGTETCGRPLVCSACVRVHFCQAFIAAKRALHNALIPGCPWQAFTSFQRKALFLLQWLRGRRGQQEKVQNKDQAAGVGQCQMCPSVYGRAKSVGGRPGALTVSGELCWLALLLCCTKHTLQFWYLLMCMADVSYLGNYLCICLLPSRMHVCWHLAEEKSGKRFARHEFSCVIAPRDVSCLYCTCGIAPFLHVPPSLFLPLQDLVSTHFF